MIAATKLLGIILATISMLLATLFGIASAIASESKDPAERHDALLSAGCSLVVVALCAAAIVSLSGCQAAKTIIDTCRDGLCR